MSILTEFTVDGGNNVSVEEVSGALARRRRKAEADVEERIRSSREKMAAGKERDIASPQKRRREHRRVSDVAFSGGLVRWGLSSGCGGEEEETSGG